MDHPIVVYTAAVYSRIFTQLSLKFLGTYYFMNKIHLIYEQLQMTGSQKCVCT